MSTNDATLQKFKMLATLTRICQQKGMRQVIISPGSRSAPLTVSFNRCPDLECRVIMDERAAGFVALGLAQQTGRPVGLVCTSGTAALNYGPAVAEAFYQQIPLVVFTADRPPEWLDQEDGQTIHQAQLYGRHTRGNFEFPVDQSQPDAAWHGERIVSEAINRAVWPTPGPVHLNVPLREPLYPPPEMQIEPAPIPKIIAQPRPQATLSPETWADLQATWQQAPRKLVIAGLQATDPALGAALTALQQDPAVAVIADITANLHHSGLDLPHSDMILGTKSAETLEQLKPDLIVTCGGPVISKYLKLFLRRNRPIPHWHIRADGQPVDTYQSLTQIIAVHPVYFFETLASRQATHPANNEANPDGTYQQVWRVLETKARQRLQSFLTDSPFSEFSAVYQVMRALPPHSNLQLGNSMPVRYANFIGLGPDMERTGIWVNANRGTSGIDGCLSTTVGAALAGDQMTTLISGDLAFFYDRNGLWHRHVPSNLRVVILNNGGGGIFKLIEGPNNLPATELEEYFFTPQPLTAKNTAADHHCAYFQANNAEALAHQLPAFFAPQPTAAILEIKTDSALNTQVFQQFKSMLATIAS